MRRSFLLYGFLCVAGLGGCAAAPQAPETSVAPTTPAMEGGGPAHTSRTEFPVPKRWDSTRLGSVSSGYAHGAEEHGTPLVLGPVAYTGYSGRVFEARRWGDGTRLWSVSTRGRVVGSAAYGEGLFFVADDEGYLLALRPDGKEAWRFHANYPIVASPVAAGRKVYIAVSDQNVFCLEAANGRPIWQYGRKFPRRNSQWKTPSLAWAQDRCYVGFSDGAVVALDADVGRVVWKADVGKEGLFSDIVAGPSIQGGRVFAGALRGPLVSLDAATGKEIWRRDVEVSSGFAVGDGVVYAGTPSGKVLALSSMDGAKLWETALGKGLPTAPVLAGDTVLAGASEGDLVALDAKTGVVKQRWAPGSGILAQPLVFEGGILLVANNGALYLIQEDR